MDPQTEAGLPSVNDQNAHLTETTIPPRSGGGGATDDREREQGCKEVK